MLKELFDKFHLGLFGEGGEGGDAGAEGEGTETAGEEIPSSIPARARENYRKALEKTRPREARAEEVPEETTETTDTAEETQTHVPYADLIKSDEYKAEHKAYMDKTISDRLKKYKGIEETAGKQSALLGMVAQKYGLDAKSDTFLDDLQSKIEADDSYYESYAMEHDVSTSEARRIVSLERRAQEAEAREQARAEEEERRAQWQMVMQNAEKTKAMFPSFDFETEWQNPDFARLTARLGGDVMTAYKVTHFNELQRNTVQQVSQQVAQQTVNAVKANKARPIENGIGGSVASQTVAQDFSKMNIEQLRAWAAEQRRKPR